MQQTENGTIILNPADNPYQQQYQYQNNGGNYMQNNTYQPQTEPTNDVSMKEWLLAMFIQLVPIVNIVMVFVWAFSKSTKKSKSNFFKAQLVFALIMSAIAILIAILGSTMLVGMIKSF